ncbi:MAG: type II secretion system F family protein [Coriobacteriales bacterium]
MSDTSTAAWDDGFILQDTWARTGGSVDAAADDAARSTHGTHTLLESGAVSAFCGSFAQMTAAGIQTEEAARMLASENAEGPFKRACESVYRTIASGKSLGTAMRNSGAFPDYACSLVSTGEAAGRMEDALVALDRYYSEEDRLFTKLRTNVRQPAIILCIMTVVLAITDLMVLPAFSSAYENVQGSLSGGSFAMVGVAAVIGWVALALTFAGALVALFLTFRAGTEEGRERLSRTLEKLPATRDAFYQLAVARFSLVLSAHISSGDDSNTALAKAAKTVSHPLLYERVSEARRACTDLQNPKGLVDALSDNDVYDPFYARMLQVGDHTATLGETLSRCADIFFEDALDQFDRATDNIEPVLTALLTIAVGASLVAVMLPLIGIMQSIG